MRRLAIVLCLSLLGTAPARRLGWKRATVQVGDQLTVEGSLGRFKPNLANATSAILLRTGERLGTASSQPGR